MYCGAHNVGCMCYLCPADRFKQFICCSIRDLKISKENDKRDFAHQLKINADMKLEIDRMKSWMSDAAIIMENAENLLPRSSINRSRSRSRDRS